MSIRIASAEEFRRSRQPFPVDLRPGLTVLVRQPHMLTLTWIGAVSLPMVKALERFDEARAEHNGALSGEQALERLSQIDRDMILEIWKRYACHAVIQPVFVLEPDAHPDHLLVDDLEVYELNTIFYARPPKTDALIENTPRLEVVDRETFPAGAEPVPSESAPDGEGVRTNAVVVDLPNHEYIGQ